ncbi:hypothetical protein H4Q26_013337 [Puccinia striiformis f. sp. tritici PST-130]|nr:hypothetical protein H4Q26_013337 [Puccinia striiformis f. sp. tritici PST-130]
MPRKSERQKVLQGVEMTLIASLWKLKMADRKSKAMRTNPSHQLTFNFLITAILQMKKLLSNDVLLINLNVSLVNLRLRNSAISLHNDMVKEGLVKCKKQVSLIVNLIDELSAADILLVGTDDPKKFYSLADALKDHHIFYNNSNNPQAPVEMQLWLLSPTWACMGTVAPLIGIGRKLHKSVHLGDHRDLEKKHVYWPNAQQRATFTATLAGRTVFDRCIGFVDGAIFPLTSAPTKHKEDYWMRKMVYATAKRLNAWLRACVVLHNYLLDLCKAEWDELNNPVKNFDPDEDEEIDSGVISGEDVARRDLLFSRFCQLL